MVSWRTNQIFSGQFFPCAEMQAPGPLAVLDYILILLLVPFFCFRLVHWFVDRKLIPDRRACKLVDGFYLKYSNCISKVEIRPGRMISVLQRNQPAEGVSRGMVIFVHGSCARMQQFQKQIEYFHDAGFDVLSYDALGCGASESPVGDSLYKTREMFEDLIGVLTKYTKERRVKAVSIVGHSFGAALVSKIAASRDSKNLTKSVVSLCQPSYSSDSKKALAIFKLPVSVLWLIRPLLGVKARDLLFGPTDSSDLRRQEKEASARNPVHIFRSFYNGIDPSFLDSETVESELHVPVLFIAGEYDKLCSPAGVEAIAKRFKSNTKFAVVTGCGHQCMQEDPDQVNGVIDEFLKQLPAK